MSRQNIILGTWGENAADNYLQEKGYEIISKNYRTPYGEIDIICSFMENLIFVEVKTRKSHSFGHPEVSVNPRKLEHMETSAQYYVQEIGFQGTWQIDVISILKKTSNQLEIVHFENVIS